MTVLGARLAWCAESDRHAAAVLAARYPGVPNLGDITALDWAAVPPVDLITAGWPCQDISYSGPGAGITKGTRSGLWLTIAAGLRQLRPRTSSWKTSPRSARGASAKSSPTWPRSGMTRNGRAFAPPTPAPRTAATASSSSPPSPNRRAPRGRCRLWSSANSGDGEATGSLVARRDRQKQPGRDGNGIGTPPPAVIALLPTPMAGDFGADKDACPGTALGGQTPDRPAGCDRTPPPRRPRRPGPGTGEPGPGPAAAHAGHRLLAERARPAVGWPGNGHQSGQGLDVTAAALSPGARSRQPAPARPRGRSTSRRSAAGSASWGHPAPPPAEPGPSGRPGCRPRSPSG